MMTLADAIQNLKAGAYPFSEANGKKIIGSANKCARLPAYNCPVEMVPVDLDAFEGKWSKKLKNKDTPEGFDNFRQFKVWHSNVKTLMNHASGRHAEALMQRKQEDDWKRLRDGVSSIIENHEKSGVQATDLISLTVLQSVAREHGVQPASLTKENLKLWMHNMADAGRRNALRKSACLLDKLHHFSGHLSSSLLPSIIGALPKVTKTRQTPAFPHSVADAIDTYLHELSVGEKYKGLAANHSRKPLSPRTIKSVREQLAWYFTCLIELGHLDPEGEVDIRKLMSLENILAAFDAETAGEFYWKPLAKTTNKKNMGAVFRFARRFHPEFFDVQQEFFKGSYFVDWDTMTKENQDFCRRLVQSPRRSLKFMNLPKHLFEDAVEQIARFDSLSEGQKANALRLAVAAAASAILMFIPLRADTLINLKVTGEDANIFFLDESKDVRLSIEASMMKNKKSMVANYGRRGKVNPAKILNWWMREARPLVMEQIQTPDPTMLFGGARYHYLAAGWRLATAGQDIYMTLHQVRHGIASILINHPGVNVDDIAAVLNNTPTTVLKTYAFFDREKSIQVGMAGLKAVNAALEKGFRG
ncbi:hypothetical protein GGR95_003202 [Sulfitobacter undariae]|uniref:Uncharacterized protein n=1 Tax=Sulfitobacter undariae TaxID=1563671 RepID=A0A7W6E6B9_9RHOB|nr:hypothetical protein [Sulfitobacter undariae]MBB3995545.1 hypothetical protein [Sulfitobacter undariae]